MADETTQPVEQQKVEEKNMKCPCCGQMTLHRPPEIKSAVLDEYMASIIAGVAFQHTYPIYGTIDITVATLTKQESRTLYSALQALDKLLKSRKITDQAVESAMEELFGSLQLYCTIPAIKTYKDKKLQKEFNPSAAVFKACDKILSMQNDIEGYYGLAEGRDVAPDANVPDGLMAIYKDCCTEDNLSSLPDLMLKTITRTHRDIYNILMETGFDENFWKGIELT